MSSKQLFFNNHLMKACVAAVFAFGLAACGSSSDQQTTAPTEPTEPTEPIEPGPADLTELFAAAQDASDDATAAGEAAAAAVKSATESARKLTTLQVRGDSATAMASAQAILDAQENAAQAVKDAQAALDTANAVKKSAEDVADDHPQRHALISAIDAAIEKTEAALKAATNVRDGDDIEDAVDAVVGDDKDDPGTPRSIANKVGRDIAAALATTATGAGTRVTHLDSDDTTIRDNVKVKMHDHVGMTWAEIVGKDNLVEERIGASNTVVQIASVAGMAAATVDSDLSSTGGPNSDGKYADAFTSPGSTYMGIPGDVWCLGDDCEVNAAGVLVGSWYFAQTAANAMVYYIRNPDATAAEDTPYVPETLFAEFGYWLTVNPSTNQWTLNTYTDSDGGTEYTLVANANLGDTATYSGTAAGMSVLRTDSADGKGQDVDSGGFTANVSLTAEFGAIPTISGVINRFKGSAVNENWTVTLQEAALAADGDKTADVPTITTGRDGLWSNRAYGSAAGARPAGIIGDFTAHFSDGDAAGAYATRRDD